MQDAFLLWYKEGVNIIKRGRKVLLNFRPQSILYIRPSLRSDFPCYYCGKSASLRKTMDINAEVKTGLETNHILDFSDRLYKLAVGLLSIFISVELIIIPNSDARFSKLPYVIGDTLCQYPSLLKAC